MPKLKREGDDHVRALTEPFGHIGPFVYFIQPEAGGPVKIGTTFDLFGRWTTLQSTSPVPLVVRYVLPGGRKEELALHHLFAHGRRHGEWFVNVDEVLAYADEANARLRENGVAEARRRRGELWTEIQEKYLDGKSVETIAEEIGSSRRFVYTELRKMRERKYVVPLRHVTKLPAKRRQTTLQQVATYGHVMPAAGEFDGHTADFADDLIERLSA